MGAVNGMAMALASLSRALGPAVGGAAWAVCVSLPNGLTFTGFAAMVRPRPTTLVTHEEQRPTILVTREEQRLKPSWDQAHLASSASPGRGGGARSHPCSSGVATCCRGRLISCLNSQCVAVISQTCA